MLNGFGTKWYSTPGTSFQRTSIQGNSLDYIGMCWMGLFSHANLCIDAWCWEIRNYGHGNI